MEDLRLAIQLFRADIWRKYGEANSTLNRIDSMEIVEPHPGFTLRLEGTATGYASVLDLIDTMMRENGILQNA